MTRPTWPVLSLPDPLPPANAAGQLARSTARWQGLFVASAIAGLLIMGLIHAGNVLALEPERSDRTAAASPGDNAQAGPGAGLSEQDRIRGKQDRRVEVPAPVVNFSGLEGDRATASVMSLADDAPEPADVEGAIDASPNGLSPGEQAALPDPGTPIGNMQDETSDPPAPELNFRGLDGDRLAAAEQGLDAAILAALRHHPLLQGKLAERQALAYAVQSAKAKRYPSLSAQISSRKDSEEQASVGVQQPLWTFGRLRSQIDFAKAAYSSEQWGALAVQRELVESVAAAYARVQGAHAQLDEHESNVREHRRLFELQARRQRGRLATDADRILAQARLLEAQARWRRAAGELREAESELLSLTRTVIDSSPVVDAGMTSLPRLDELLQFALHDSAQVLYMGAKVQEARQNVRVSSTASMPSLSLNAEHSAGQGYIEREDARVGVSLSMNFEGLGLVRRANVKQSELLVEAAMEAQQATAFEQAREMEDLFLKRDTAGAVGDLLAESVALLELSFASDLRQFEAGRKSWIEVMNMQRDLMGQRLELAQARNEVLIYSLRIAARMGRFDGLAEQTVELND